ncbi:MAG: insulinase family protein [bacterium]|nr:insulinase family protein [bacterium]
MSHAFELEEKHGPISSWKHTENGLRALCLPTTVAPVAAFGVVYEVGSRYEGTGQTGATHILEHLMFKGTQRFNRDKGTEIARVLQRVGASFNATTWVDRTNYYETLPAEELPLAVEIEADRMRGALVRAEDLASERTVVLNELERGENEPMELLIRGLFAHSFVEHGYRHPTIGWRSDVEKISAETLRDFYDAYYHPDNATAIVVGEVDENQVLNELERHFGVIPRAKQMITRPDVIEPEQLGERRFNIHRAGEIGHVGLSWRIPAAMHDDLPALSVLAQILAEGVTSRLHQRLVESNLCLSVHAFAMELRDPGVFQIFATPVPGVDHDQVEGIIRSEVAGVLDDTPTEEELNRAKILVRTDLAFRRESPTQIVAALTEAVAAGDWRKILREQDEIAAVRIEDIVRVASTYLHDLNLTAGWFVPESTGNGSTAFVTPGPRPCFLQQPFAERVQQFELPGGARLAVLANPHAPTVTIAGSLAAGVACASDGRFSVPGLTAAMLDRGTVDHDRMALARELEGHGLQLGVEASSGLPSAIVFSAQGLAEELPRLSNLAVEILRRPSFPAEELDKLRVQVLGSLVREQQETFPVAYGALSRRLFPAGHPQHRRTVEEREEEVRSLKCEDLQAFHERCYGPAALSLAVVGDVAPQQIADRFTQLFTEWTGGLRKLPSWPKSKVKKASEERLPIADRPNLDVFLGHAGSLLRGDADYPAVVLGNSCLGQSTLTSRLGAKVRDEAGLTYGIVSRFFGTMHLPGPWAIYLTVGAADIDAATTMCREILADYVERGPEESELEDERLALAGAYRVGLATNAGAARELVTALAANEPIQRIDEYPARILAVTRAEVLAGIRRHLHPDRLILTAAGSFPPKS